MIDERLTLAFQLAYFIHGDPVLAKRLAVAAIEKLETATLAQDKRLYYAGNRYKVSMPELHLLQRLVYAESEGEEKQQEQQPLSERTLLIHFIKHLVKLTVRRNSLHVAVGLSRLLHYYSTAETMALYDVIRQNPARVAAEDYFRSRKKMLLTELKERFGELLATTRGPRGEERFVTHEQPQRFVTLVRECLAAFTPWHTPCSVPERFDPTQDFLPACAFTGTDPDEEHTIEINRIHALLHPPCLAGLMKALQHAAPDEQLAIPRFFPSQRHDENPDDDSDDATPHSRNTALEEADHLDLQRHLHDRSRRRKFSPAGLLLFVADGQIVQQLDLQQSRVSQFSLATGTEFLEVRTRDANGELVLATYPLMYHDDDQVPPQQRQFTLEGGQRLSFALRPTLDGATVQFVYQETHPLRALRLWFRQPRLAIMRWKPALALALFALLVGGISYFVWQSAPPKQQLAGYPSSSVAPTATLAPSLTPSLTPSVMTPPPRPDDKVIARDVRGRATSPTENLMRNERESGVDALLTGQKLYLEVSGSEPVRTAMSAALQQGLQASGKVQLTGDRDAAEVALKVTIQPSAQAERITVLARIVNADGKVIWPLTPNTRGRQYSGLAEKVFAKINRDLENDLRRVRR